MSFLLPTCLFPVVFGAAVQAQPVETSSPTARHLTEQEAEERLAELGEALGLGQFSLLPPPPGEAQDAYGLLAFKARQPPWYTMTLTKRQWLRWQRKAQAWHEDQPLRRMYKDDIQRYSGDLRGSQIAAIVDVLAVHIQERHPNPFTGLLVNSFLLWEKVTRELPIELRDDTYAYLSDSARGALGWDHGSEPEDLGPDPLGEEEEAEPEPSQGFSWRRFKPRVRLKANPRWKLRGPSAKVGAGLEWRLAESLRFKLSADYDSKDHDRSAAGMFVLGGSGGRGGSGDPESGAQAPPAGTAGEAAQFDRALARYKECRGMAYDVTPVREAERLLAAYLRDHPQGSRIAQARALRAEIREKLGQRDLDTARFYLDRSARPWSALVYVEAVLCDWPDTKAYFGALETLREIAGQDDDARARQRAREVMANVDSGKPVPGHGQCRARREAQQDG